MKLNKQKAFGFFTVVLILALLLTGGGGLLLSPSAGGMSNPAGETPTSEPATATPTPTKGPTFLPIVVGPPKATPTQGVLPPVLVVESSGDVQGDPYACWDQEQLRVGDWDDSDNIIRLVMIGCTNQNLVLPMSALTTEQGSNRPARWTYWLALSFPDGSKFFASMLKPYNWGYQHIHRAAMNQACGSQWRLDNIGHTAHRNDPGLPKLRILGGQTYYYNDPLVLAGMQLCNTVVTGVMIYYPDGRHFPGFSVKVETETGMVQFIVAKVTEPDPALINGKIRALTWSGFDLNATGVDGVYKYLLQGKPVPNPAQFVWGVVDGYPEGVAASSPITTGNVITPVHPLVLELFGEEWNEVESTIPPTTTVSSTVQ